VLPVHKIWQQAGVSPDIRVQGLENGDIQKLACPPPKSFHPRGRFCAGSEGMPSASARTSAVARRRHRMGLPVRGQRTRTNARTPGVPAKPWPQKKISRSPCMPAAALRSPFPYPRHDPWQKPARKPRQKNQGATPQWRCSHPEHLNNTSCRSPTRQVKLISWSSLVPAVSSRSQRPLSLRRTPQSRWTPRLDQGMRQIEVLVRGPGLRRENRDRCPDQWPVCEIHP